jgi:radical SAM superfamily enzyme YgiQ (UPF0313 family)
MHRPAIVMKKISLVQVNFQQGPTDCNSYYLPYSIGSLWCYANQFDSIQSHYKLEHILWRRDEIEPTAQLLKDQDVIGISCYIWNRNYNYELAKRIKELNPRVKIIFGGPEPNLTAPDIFVKHPYIDCIIKLEGEIIFRELLDNIDDPAVVKGLLVNHNGTRIDTGDGKRIEELEQLPSPYLSGFFDSLISDYPNIEWAATLETNRGCPYQCTFCDWGSLTYNKVKKMPVDRVMQEIEWMGKNKCAWMAITDANFGMFIERDNAILDKYIEVQEQYGFPYSFTASYAKNQKVEVLDMITKLIRRSRSQSLGLRVSIQSLTDNVLQIIKRKNLRNDDCEKIFALAEERNVPVGTEMILGLPGETFASWRQNFWRLFEMGLHSGIDIYFCQLLENSEMNQVQRDVYDIKTALISDYIDASDTNVGAIQENVEVVVETSSMPAQDLIEAATFSWFVTTLHFYGFTNFISRFLRKYKNVNYETFYTKLYEFLCHDEWFMSEVDDYQNLLQTWFRDGKVTECFIHDVRILGWNLNYKTVMRLHEHEDRIDHLFELIESYVANEFDIESRYFDDLFRLQSNYVIPYSKTNTYPRQIDLNSNLYEYIISSNQELQDTPARLQFENGDPVAPTRKDYLEKIYFRRSKHYSNAWIYK